MSDAPPIRNISDTARWAAVFRARESDRPDAAFRDPYALRLAGERGLQIYDSVPPKERNEWAWITRTYLHDAYITECVRAGADMVVNLAAGLDARPYRLELPPSLQWIEVDLPEIIAYKEEVLAKDRPRCALRRVQLDLADVEGRRRLFAELGQSAKRALVVTEGILIYLTAEQNIELASDLAQAAGFRNWALELVSPGLLRMLHQSIGPRLAQAGAPLKFAPEEGPDFFKPYGWQPLEVRSILKTAARLGRLKFLFRLMALLPASNGRQGSRPWSAVCLYERAPR